MLQNGAVTAEKLADGAVTTAKLADGAADAFVSAGPTGALIMGATLIVRRIRGVKRPAFGAVIPSVNGFYILMDCGANAYLKIMPKVSGT